MGTSVALDNSSQVNNVLRDHDASASNAAAATATPSNGTGAGIRINTGTAMPLVSEESTPPTPLSASATEALSILPEENEPEDPPGLASSLRSNRTSISSINSLHSSTPPSRPQSSSNAADTLHRSHSFKASLKEKFHIGSPQEPSSYTDTDASSPPNPTPKRAHTFSLHRRRTMGSHDAPPSAQAKARQQAAVSNSTAESIPFSFAKGGGAMKLGTASDLNYASNISSYQSSQRPVPQSGSIANRRSFSLSKLSTKFKHGNSTSSNPPTTASDKKTGISFGSRNSSVSSVATDSSSVSVTGKEKVSPSSFLPPELQVPNWSLSAKYSMSKVPALSKNKLLGKGATAVVKLVQSKTQKMADGSKQLFAAKIYNKCSEGENLYDHYSKLADEYMITIKLHHKNIVQFHDLCLDSGDSWCAIMDYCDGGDLFSLMESYKEAHRKMPKEERNCLFKQLLMGVNYIHSQGIAHRDIKPENLLMNSLGELKISDFGVSVMVFDVSKNETSKDAHLTVGFAGSIPYLPPEVIEAKKEPKTHPYDARLVDIWSCACTFINLMIGGGFFGLASLKDDLGYRRFMRELDRYWQHEKNVHDFLKAEGETNLDEEAFKMVLQYIDVTGEQARLVQQMNAADEAEKEAEKERKKRKKEKAAAGKLGEEIVETKTRDAESNGEANDIAKPDTELLPADSSTAFIDTAASSSSSSNITPSIDISAAAEDGSVPVTESSTNSSKYTRADIMNMSEEQQPLFFFNEFGEAGKRLLARMLLPDPALRPQIDEIINTSVIRRLGTCVGYDSIPTGKGLPSSAAEFKKFKEMNAHVLNHKHKVPSKGPSLLGLGFKDPYKDYF